VRIVRHGKQYDATHRLPLVAAEVRRRYRIRAQSEAVIRVCQDQLGVTGCQARSERAQPPHSGCGVVACCGLEQARQARGLSIDTRKRLLSFKGRSIALPTLERLRRAA
jgi:hypothetical protein